MTDSRTENIVTECLECEALLSDDESIERPEGSYCVRCDPYRPRYLEVKNAE